MFIVSANILPVHDSRKILLIILIATVFDDKDEKESKLYVGFNETVNIDVVFARL